MMVEVTWLVVADGGRARVFKMPGLTLDLQEVEVLVNDEYTGTVLTEKDREKFAKRVGDYLEEGRLHQLYNRLRLAIEAKFLGMVRSNLSEDTRRLIFEQISEDLLALNTQEIESRLRKQ
ncbi:host attachment protein [Paraburkholderia sediminicola]|uniref:host attachment protein n=1 Tax=Paraburkholderia sediminicola TaxID=458836 RepID=UPI0038B6C815